MFGVEDWRNKLGGLIVGVEMGWDGIYITYVKGVRGGWGEERRGEERRRQIPPMQ